MARESEKSALEKAWTDALTKYSKAVEKSLELVNSDADWATLEANRVAERLAFDEYRKARRKYLEFITGASGLALILAFHLL